MATENNTGRPIAVDPILAVKDVSETIMYWQQVLGFTDKWQWGDPPTYGGVSWNGISVQFSKNPELASASKGNAIFINTRNLEAMYAFHQKQNIEIVEPLENKPWGMAGYTIREINGYYLVFAGALISDKKPSAELPSTVQIIERKPSVKEYQQLASSVGWSLYLDDEVVKKLLAAPVFAVVAEDSASHQTIGCALVFGDHASFYYIKDVIVHPDWQSKHVGSAMMQKLNHWLKNNGAQNAIVALITGEGLAPFYRPFGFAPAFGMVYYIHDNGSEPK